jgi:hypothetical protein
VRIKVHRSHGHRMSASNTAEVGVRSVPHLVEEGLRPRDQILVYQWAALNERTLVDYWEGRLSTREFLARLQKLPPSAAPP